MFKEYDKNTYKEKEIKCRTPFRTSIKKIWSDVHFWRFVAFWFLLGYLLSSCTMVANAAELPEEQTESELGNIVIEDEESLEEIIPSDTTAPDEITQDEIVNEDFVESDLDSEISLASDDGAELTEYQTQVLSYLSSINTSCIYLKSVYTRVGFILFFMMAVWTTERVKVIVRRFSRNE